jgi:hypothetical protein
MCRTGRGELQPRTAAGTAVQIPLEMVCRRHRP